MEKYQVFTPARYVIKLLNSIEYRKNLTDKLVIDNACGDGKILLFVVRRYIKDALNNVKSLESIKNGLENNIYGIEIDIIHYETCIKKLNDYVLKYNIKNVAWKIYNEDALRFKVNCCFDYILGNPPYITYKEIKDKDRTYIRKNFNSCKKGKFDYCYPFIEKSLSILNNNGKLAYLIPNSIFKNVFANELRKMILPYLDIIIDQKMIPVFKDVIVSTAIIVCNKGHNKDVFQYRDVYKKTINYFPKNSVTNKWLFIERFENEIKQQRFGDYFHASNSIATLCNNVFVLKNVERTSDFIRIKSFYIDYAILKKAKSPRNVKNKKEEWIIFPYKYNKNQLVHYSELDFKNKFPSTLQYLEHYKKILSKNIEKDKSQWFEYGRSQALNHLNQSKLLLSTIVTDKIRTYLLKKNDIPYAGIYIISKSTKTLLEAKSILESESFLNYAKIVGTYTTANSVRISAKDINNYMF